MSTQFKKTKSVSVGYIRKPFVTRKDGTPIPKSQQKTTLVLNQALPAKTVLELVKRPTDEQVQEAVSPAQAAYLEKQQAYWDTPNDAGQKPSDWKIADLHMKIEE